MPHFYILFFTSHDRCFARRLEADLCAKAYEAVSTSCLLPSSYQWAFTGPLAGLDSGWISLKDFTHVSYSGYYLVYASDVNTGGSYGSMNFGLFSDWSEMI